MVSRFDRIEWAEKVSSDFFVLFQGCFKCSASRIGFVRVLPTRLTRFFLQSDASIQCEDEEGRPIAVAVGVGESSEVSTTSSSLKREHLDSLEQQPGLGPALWCNASSDNQRLIDSGARGYRQGGTT